MPPFLVRPALRPLLRCVWAALLLLAGLAPPALAQPAPPDDPEAALARVVADAIEADTLAGSMWGVEIRNLQTGEILHRRNASTTFVPASNVKLFTTAAALDQLGPAYRYKTVVYADGPVEDNVLQGNLIVRGSGDPTLGGYEQRDDPTRVFRQWADSLRRQGISRINGAVIGDPTRFHDTPFGHGWTWKDLSSGYGAAISGLVFNENAVDLEVRGRAVGEPAHIRRTPQGTDYVQIVNQTETVPRSVEDETEYERELGTNTVRMRSRVYPGAEDDPSVAVHDPALYFAHTLRAVLVEEGISIAGEAATLREAPIDVRYDSATVRPVASYTSPPLSDVVLSTSQESRNLYAEQLVRTLAVEASPETDDDLPPGSSALGLEAVHKTLERAGVDTSRVQLADGSGLSRQNLASPRAVIEVLRHMWSYEDPTTRSAFVQSLPRGGKDGTLEYRFRGPASAGSSVRAKTGTLSNVSALSGYVPSGAGTPLAFSLLCNHHHADADAVRAAQDEIVNALARLPL